MMTNKSKIISTVWVIVVFYTTSVWAISPAPITMSPSKLAIGTFFAGKNVTFSGTLQPEEEIVIEIIGPKSNAEFHIKRRVGVLWMNREKVEFEGAPFLYVLLLPRAKGLEQRLGSLPVGTKNLQKSIAIHPEGMNQAELFDQFFQLKHSQQLYNRRNDAIYYRRKGGGAKIYEATFHFPSSAVPGGYQIITTVLMKSGEAVKSVYPFEVEEEGIIKYIRDLAIHQGLIYGILSVVIALLVGAITGVFFKQSGAH